MDFSEAAEAVSDFRDDLGDGLEDALDDGMDDVQEFARRNLRDEDSIARGVLYSQVNRNAAIYAPYDTIAKEEVTFPWWAKYVEYGTGNRGSGRFPSADPMPPYDDILTWIVSKPVVPREYDSQYELASAIQTDIGQHGTESHRFVRPAWMRGRPHVTRLAERSMRRATRRNF